MDLLRKVGCTMSCVLLLLLSAVPANAADLDVPDWYGGAVKALERMGVKSQDMPWWSGKGTARQVLQMKDDKTLTIDADLDARQDATPSQADIDKALADHAAKIAYKDKTVNLREYLNAIGRTFADGYADSVNGAKHYGDSGYIPTEDEINQEQQKLVHTSSYLLVQAMNLAGDDATVASSPSSCSTMGAVVDAVDRVWNDGRETAGTYLANVSKPKYDPDFGDVIQYDSKAFKNYDALSTLDRDGGALYYDEIEKELTKRSKSSGIHPPQHSSGKMVGKVTAKSVFAGVVQKGKGLLKDGITSLATDGLVGLFKDGTSNLINLTYGTQAWCDSYAWAIGGQSSPVIGTLGTLGKEMSKYLLGTDCDELDARNQAVKDAEWAAQMNKLHGANESHSSKQDGWSWSWSPWYTASSPAGSLYIRFPVFSGPDGLSFVQVADAEAQTDVTSGLNMELMGPFFGPKNDPGNYTYMTEGSLNPFYSDISHLYTRVLQSGEAEYAPDVTIKRYGFYRPNKTGTVFKSYDSYASIVPGTTDWVVSHLALYVQVREPAYREYKSFHYFSSGYFAGMDTGMAYSAFQQLIGDNFYAFTACGESCPAAYRPQQNTQDLTASTSVTDGDGTTHVVQLGGQNAGSKNGYAPSMISTKLNDDGSIGGNVSIDATTKDGQKVNFGSGSLDGIYPNTTGKRLDLIDTVTGKSCFEEGYACADWVKETQTLVPEHQLDVNFKGTTKEYPNLKYKCSYDVPGKITEVPLGECIAYAPQFKPEAQKSGQTTGRPDGSTSDQTTTEPDKGYDWNDCVKSATSETAAAWLYSPITCAAHQLFIPDTKIMTTTAVKFRHDTDTGIMPQFRQLQTNWGALFDSFGGDCHGIKLNFAWNGIKVFDDAEVLNACPGTQLEFLPTLAKAGITVGLAIMAFSICRKAVMAIFDFNIPDGGGDA